MTKKESLVVIIMGSDSDWPIMKHAAEVLDDFNISYEAQVVSAHRTPDLMFKFAEGAKEKGFQVNIA
jgi:5-(carboxyamino)imidazole ribonucleotide mutase